jgi:hypothetical protein
MTPMTPNNLPQLGRIAAAFLMRFAGSTVDVSRVIGERFHYDTTLTRYDTGAGSLRLTPR